MTRYNSIIEYTPSEKSDEEAMLEVEISAFIKAAQFMRGKTFTMVKIETNHQRQHDYADLSSARCTIYLG